MGAIVWCTSGRQEMLVEVATRHLKCDLSETMTFRETLCYEMDSAMWIFLISLVITRSRFTRCCYLGALHMTFIGFLCLNIMKTSFQC